MSVTVQSSAVLLEAFVAGHPVPEPRPRATVLPGKVVAGHVVRRPKALVYTPRQGAVKAWKRTVYLSCLPYRPPRPAAGLVSVWLTFTLTPSAFQAEDVDNLGKAVLDALRGLAYVDDRQVQRASFEKAPWTPTGVHIRVEAISLEGTPVVESTQKLYDLGSTIGANIADRTRRGL